MEGGRNLCAICDGGWSPEECERNGKRVVCLDETFHGVCFKKHFGFEAPVSQSDKDFCPECTEEVLASTLAKIIVQGKVFHIECYRKKYNVNFSAKTAKPQDNPNLPNCPICDGDVHAADSSTWVGGQPYHSKCYQDTYGKEQAVRAEQLDQCPSCQEVVELSDMGKVIIKGEVWHQECYRKDNVIELVETARPQDDPTLPNCPICDKDVHKSDSQSWHGGEPYHTKCWNDAHPVAEAASQSNADHCPECSAEVVGTEKVIVKGIVWHQSCYRKVHKIEEVKSIKPQDDPNVPNCPVCDLDVYPGTPSAYLAGKAYHSQCYRERYGTVVTEKEEEKDHCPDCGEEVRTAAEKIIVQGVVWHNTCYRNANKKMTIRGMKKFVETCRICRKEVEPGQEHLFVQGHAWHRPCYTKFMGLKAASE